MLQYVEFDRAAAKQMWECVDVELVDFKPMQALRDGVAIVGVVDINCLYELSDTCAVQITVGGCELQVDPEEKNLNLQAGLNISPELRAVLTQKVSVILKSELSEAIEGCAEWIEATAGAPDGFVGEAEDVPAAKAAAVGSGEDDIEDQNTAIIDLRAVVGGDKRPVADDDEGWTYGTD